MSLQPPLPKREAIVVWQSTSGKAWRECLDIDPILVPVEMCTSGLMADVFDPFLLGLMDGLCVLDDSSQVRYKLVWSDGWADVMGMCPLCDKPFPVFEGVPGDEFNEGVNAITCGCWNG